MIDSPNPAPGVVELNPKFGEFGGQFVPETLMPALAELEACSYLDRKICGFPTGT